MSILTQVSRNCKEIVQQVYHCFEYHTIHLWTEYVSLSVSFDPLVIGEDVYTLFKSCFIIITPRRSRHLHLTKIEESLEVWEYVINNDVVRTLPQHINLSLPLPRVAYVIILYCDFEFSFIRLSVALKFWIAHYLIYIDR